MLGLFLMTKDLRSKSKISTSGSDFRWRVVWKFNFRFALTLPKVAKFNFREGLLKHFLDMTTIRTRYMQIYGLLVVENYLVWWLLTIKSLLLMIAIPFLTHFHGIILVFKSQGIENARPRWPSLIWTAHRSQSGLSTDREKWIALKFKTHIITWVRNYNWRKGVSYVKYR